MSLDVIPLECQMGETGGCGYISPDCHYCLYSCPMEGKCPYAFKAPEPSPEVLEEKQHQKEIQSINRSTQKLVHQLQHSKMKLALLKLNKEIEELSSIAPLNPEPITINTATEKVKECKSEKDEKSC